MIIVGRFTFCIDLYLYNISATTDHPSIAVSMEVVMIYSATLEILLISRKTVRTTTAIMMKDTIIDRIMNQ